MLATSSPWISALPLRLVRVFIRQCVRLSTLLACRFSSHLVTTMATHPLQNAPSSKQCSTQARTTSGSATRRLRMCAPRTGCGHPVFRQGALPPIHALGLSIGRASSLDRRCLERTTHLLVACHAHPTTERARPRGGRSGRRVCLVLGCVRRRRRCAAHAPACSPRVWSRSFQSVRECPRVTHQCDVRRCVQVRPSTKLLRRCLPSGFLWLHGPERAHSGRTQCSSPQPNIHIHRGGSGPILCPKGDGHPSEVRSPLMTSDDL